MSKTIRIGLLWHSLSSNNLGVGALTISQIMLIERLAKELNISPRYLLIGTQGSLDYTPEQLGDRVSTIRFSPKNLLSPKVSFRSELQSCDIILDIGEGDSFSDIYGMTRFVKLALSKLIAQGSSRPMVLSPQTVGPFTSPLSKRLASYLLKRSVRVFARDSSSLEFARSISPGAQIALSSDLAFALPIEAPTHHGTSDKLHIGLNVSALLYHGGYRKSNQFALKVDYRSFVLKLLSALYENDDAVVHLVPHVVDAAQDVEDDHKVNIILNSRFPETICAPKFRSPQDAKAYIAGLDFFVGSRMHSTIAAFSSGVPVLPVAYSRKFKGLFSDLGYKYTTDLAEIDSEDLLLSIVLEAIESRGSMKQDIERGMVQVRDRIAVYENFLTTELASLCE